MKGGSCRRPTSDEIVRPKHVSEDELRLGFAVQLFHQDRLTLGQASKLAGFTVGDLMLELARRQIPFHYGEESFDEDVRTLEQLDRT